MSEEIFDALKGMRRIAAIWLAAFFLSPAVAYAGVGDAITRGDEAVEAGDFSLAASCYQEVLDACKRGEADKTYGEALMHGGNVLSCLNRYIEALDFYTHAIEMAEKYGDVKVYADCMNNIGAVYAVFNDYERASWYFKKGLDASLSRKDRRLPGISAVNLVVAYCNIGDTKRALDYFRLQNEYPLEDKNLHQYYIYHNQGLIAASGDDFNAGAYYLSRARETVTSHGLPDGLLTDIECEIGKVYDCLGKTDSALANYRRVVERGNNPEKQIHAMKSMAKIMRVRGDSAEAARMEERGVRLQDSIFNRRHFNSARDRLFSYENSRTEHVITALRNRVSTLAWAFSLAAVVICVVIYYSRRVRNAQKLLVSKTRELIRQNEVLREMRGRCHEAHDAGHEEEELADTTEHGAGGADCLPEAMSPSGDVSASASKMEAELGEERVDALREKIQSVFDNPDLILKPEFDLESLAGMVGSNVRYVSMVINGVYGMNFKRLLNEYRIREACRRLADRENYGHLTIAAVAQSVGYNSVNNFINMFKKINGMTPSQYQKLAGDRL